MECERCDDLGCRGGILVGEDGSRRECPTVLRERARKYLGPLYRDSPWDHHYKCRTWLRNLLVICPQAEFRRCVKTVLLGTGMQYTHETVDPPSMVSEYIASVDARPPRRHVDPDILILDFQDINHPKNDYYETVGAFLLTTRMGLQKWTWCHSEVPLLRQFEGKYGKALVDRLKTFRKVTSKRVA